MGGVDLSRRRQRHRDRALSDLWETPGDDRKFPIKRAHGFLEWRCRRAHPTAARELAAGSEKQKQTCCSSSGSASQLPAATSSPLCVVVPSHSPSPAPSGRRLPLDRMSPRTLAHTVCMAGQFAAADALAKNGVGGNALIIYLSSENAQVTSRPYFSYWR